MRRNALATAALLVLLTGAAHAQTIAGERFTLTTGPCTLRSGSGVPATSLGVVCDTYVRTDAPYTVYVKTGASTWSVMLAPVGATGDLLYRPTSTTLGGISGVASGAVLASNGVGAAPIYTGSPSVTTLTASSQVSTPTLTATGNLTINPAGDVLVNPTGNDVLPTTNYDINLGALTTKFLTLHAAELWVETLVAQDTIATIGGRVIVSPTTLLTADLASGGAAIQVKHNQIANGDRLVLQSNGKLEWLAVTSGASGSAGAYVYSVTRNLDGSGANDWYAGDAVVNTGTTNDGFIDLYSVNGVIPGSTAGPTIVGNVRTGTTYSDIAPRWAIGNLAGLYGYATDTYGFAAGNPSAAWVKVDATNGVRLGYNTTTKIELDASGNASFAQGSLTLDENGIVLTPPTAYADPQAYRWSVDSGQLGLYGYVNSGDTLRSSSIINDSNDDAAETEIRLTAGTNSKVAQVWAKAGATDAATFITLATTTDTFGLGNGVFGSATSTDLEVQDLIIYASNDNPGSSTTKPFIRSDGSYLVINARSNGNGGHVYIGQDNNAGVTLAAGGGAVNIGTSGATTSIQNASVFTSMILNGLVSCTLAVNGSSAVGCVSDGAAKKDVERWSPGLSTIARLRPVSYRWKEGDDTDRHIGFIAQDVDKVIPEAVRRQEWGGGLLTLDDRAILAALVNAVQELQQRIR